MHQFLKLRWRIKEPSELEGPPGFITEAEVARSLVYKHLSRPLGVAAATTTTKKNHPSKAAEKYVPGKKQFAKICRRSRVNKWKQDHCLNALKLLLSGKDGTKMTQSEKFSLQIYTDCKPVIAEENRAYLEYVKDAWEKTNKVKAFSIKPGLFNYANYFWKENCNRFLDYKQFYEHISLLNMSFHETEASLKYECVQNVLELGTMARFCQPNLKEECILKIATLPSMVAEKRVHSQLPVSQDENISKLLQTHHNSNIHAVISSGGLAQIMDNANLKAKWIIPVIVKEISVRDETSNAVSKKRVVFIDKPLPKTKSNHLDFKYYTYKQLLKTNFCQYEAFKYPTSDINVISDDDKIFDDETDGTTNSSSKRTIYHNVSYRIWNIRLNDDKNDLMKNKVKDKDINLLVRCKLDGCKLTDEGSLCPVMVKPKLELQLQYGANVPTKSELSREWTSLFFRPFSEICRARLHGGTSEMISVETCTMQKINSEAFTLYDYKPCLGLGILQKILHSLIDLDAGQYLLQHLPKHESFVALLKATDHSTSNTYDLHNEYSQCTVETQTPSSNWVSIDVNYILPTHEHFRQMPGLFEGTDEKKNFKKNKGKKKKKKRTTTVKNEIELN